MADLFDQNREEKLLQAEKLLLGYMAWHMEPLGIHILNKVAEKIGVTTKEAKKMLDGLQQSGEIVYCERYSVHASGKTYALPVDLHLQLLWNLKDISADLVRLYKSIPYYTYSMDLLSSWRTALLQYASTGALTEIPRSIDRESSISTLFKGMLFHPQWKKFCLQLPAHILYPIYRQEETQWSDQLEKPDDAFLRALYFDNEQVGLEAREVYRDYYSVAEYVFPGRINDIPQSVFEGGSLGTAAHALYYQYQGRSKEAIALYQSVIKLQGGSFLEHPFYDMTYVLALMNDGDASSKKKLSALSKKRELRDVPDLLPAQLLIRLALHEETADVVRHAELDFNEFTPIVKVLVALLIYHYQLKENCTIDRSWVEACIDHDHLKLLQLEYSQDFPRFMAKADMLKQELGLSPLLSPFKKLPEWEKTFNLLMDLTAGKENATLTGTKTESQSRIVYYIDGGLQITPRLQKSKDGANWSKGRNIALTTFNKQSVEGMNETDRRLAACVRSYSGGWGVGDYSVLSGPTAFAVLAGYPLVFQEENPGVPVVITKEEPQLVVTKAPGGYRVNAMQPHLSTRTPYSRRRTTSFTECSCSAPCNVKSWNPSTFRPIFPSTPRRNWRNY